MNVGVWFFEEIEVELLLLIINIIILVFSSFVIYKGDIVIKKNDVLGMCLWYLVIVIMGIIFLGG